LQVSCGRIVEAANRRANHDIGQELTERIASATANGCIVDELVRCLP